MTINSTLVMEDTSIVLADNAVHAAGVSTAAFGGGLCHLGTGSATLVGVTIEENHATAEGETDATSTLAGGAGVHIMLSHDTLATFDVSHTLSMLTLAGNEALASVTESRATGLASGGAMHLRAGGLSTLNVAMQDCTFADNTANGSVAADGGALNIGGGAGGVIVVDMLGTTFARNTAVGGLGAAGGAMQASADGSGSSATVRVTNTTVSGNAVAREVEGLAAANGGGFLAHSEAGGLTTMLLQHTTFTLNDAQDAGGGVAFTGTASVTMGHTIVGGNTSAYAPDCSSLGALTSSGTNLVSTTQGCLGLESDDITGVDAGLAELADNGGTTQTHALLETSAGRNAGDSACSAADGANLTLDQRGEARPQEDVCDLGAFEYTP